MSKINALIKEMCPNGVKFYKLLDIGEQFNGLSGKSKKDFENGNYKYITYTNIYNNPSTNLEIEDYVQVDKNEKQNEIRFKDILIAGSSENLEDSGMISVVTKEPEDKIYLNSFCFGLRLKADFYEKFNANFLKHLFRDKNFRNEIISCSFGVTRYNLSKEKFLKIKIPCPPLEVQEEIVRILDKFGELETELEAELEARKSQYEFWREKLLKNGNNRVYLKNIAEYSKDRISFDELDENNYIGVDNLLQNKMGKTISTHVPISGNSTKFLKNDILIGNIRPYLRKIWLADCIGGTNGDVLDIRIKEKDKVDPSFLYFVLSSEDFFKYNISNSKGAKMPRGNKQAIMNYEFNLPTIDEQIKIVNILDKFEELTNDISVGLPAEIELRRKQYEYYRNKLLNFKELTNE